MMKAILLLLLIFPLAKAVRQRCFDSYCYPNKCHYAEGTFVCTGLNQLEAEDVITNTDKIGLHFNITEVKIEDCPKPLGNLTSIFPSGPNLTSVELALCDIESLNPNLLVNQPNVEELDLTFNKFRKMPRLMNAGNVKKISIYINEITSLEDGDLDTYTSLEALYIDHNPIKSLAPDSIRGAPLKNLNMMNCRLTEVPTKALANLPYLTEFLASRNQFERVGDYSFVDMPALNGVSLSSAQIKSFSPLAFRNVPAFRALALDENLLERFELDGESVPGMESIALPQNPLKELSLRNFPKLKRVNLAETNFQVKDGDIYNCPKAKVWRRGLTHQELVQLAKPTKKPPMKIPMDVIAQLESIVFS